MNCIYPTCKTNIHKRVFDDAMQKEEKETESIRIYKKTHIENKFNIRKLKTIHSKFLIILILLILLLKQ